MTSSHGVRLPLHRRMVRGALRFFRPLAVPLLSRLQWRLDHAVDRLDPKLQMLLDRDAAATARVEYLQYRVAQLHDMLQAALSHGNRLQIGVDAIRADLETALSRSNRMQIGVDAIRADQTIFTSSLASGFAEIDGSLAERFSALDLRVDEVGRSGNELMTATYQVSAGNTEEIRGLLQLQRDTFGQGQQALSRTELLLQRVAIPVEGGLLMRTAEGFLLVPENDAALAMTLWDGGGRLEPGTVAVLVGLLNEGDTVVDVGANVGLTVLPEARRVGAHGRVIAVEPASAVSRLLQRTLAINALSDRVSVHRCAAGEGPGKATLNLGFTSGHSSLLDLPGASGTEEVEIRSLDALIDPGTRIRVVKIDAEGFELQVLRGMGRILADNAELSLVVEFGPEHLHRAGVTVSDWLREFLQPGVTGYEIDEQTGVLRQLRPAEALAAVVSVNILFLRQPAAAFPGLTFE